MLIVVSGLPGTGKSTVAAALAGHINAVHLSVDDAEDALLGAGLPPGFRTGVAAYEAVRAAAQQNLSLGHHVVVDAVNDSEDARATWVRAATATRVGLRFVVLLPPPAREHRRRLEHRTRALSHVPEPTWEQVRARAASYAPWPTTILALDAGEPVAALVTAIAQAVT